MRSIKPFVVMLSILVIGGCKSTSQENQNWFIFDQIKDLDTLPLEQEIPLPGEYIAGDLDNGIQFYLRQNLQPSDRVEIRLVIRAGSLLEKESQKGFAHFVEHMAFNGTEEFSQEEILSFIQASGGKFGSHVNAFTNYDYTVYILDLPSNDPQTIETGIRLIKNWAHQISFDPIEIDKERGVILEEYRSRKNVNERLTNLHLEESIPGSRWLARPPIGEPEIIENGTHQDLIDYYETWYRPDLMSIMVIGNVDMILVAGLIDEHIAEIPAKSDKLDADDVYAEFMIAEQAEPIVSIQSDPEVVNTEFAILSLQPSRPIRTFADLREHYLIGLHTTMLNLRLHEKVISENFPTLDASVSYGNYFPPKDVYRIIAGAKNGKTSEAIRAVLTEAYRAEKNGFTETELVRAKKTWLADLENQAQTLFSEISSVYANGIFNHILYGQPLLDADDSLVFAKRVLPTITLEEINTITKNWLADGNKVVQISAPSNETDTLPTREEILSIWNEVENAELDAFVDGEIPDKLMTDIPIPGEVINKEYVEQGDYHVWTLSNGAKVVLKETYFVSGQTHMLTFSQGGSSVLSDEQYNQTRMTSQIIDTIGIADFDYITLTKYLSDKNLSLSSAIQNYYETMEGVFDENDIETFMQLMHLKFTQPRKDQAYFDNYIAYVRPQLVNQFNTPQAKFSEALRQALYLDSERNLPLDMAMLDQQSFDDMHSFYKQRFTNAGDFTFVFVGDFELDSIEPLINTYIASLPATDERESIIALADERVSGELLVNVTENIEARSDAFIEYRGKADYSLEDELAFDALRNALEIKLTKKLREEKSAAYYVHVDGHNAQVPKGEFALQIGFSTDPNRVDELIFDIEETLKELQSTLLEQSFVDDFIRQRKDRFAEKIKTNQHWAYHLMAIKDGQSYIPHDDYNEFLESLNVEKMRAVAQKYFSTGDVIRAVLRPSYRSTK